MDKKNKKMIFYSLVALATIIIIGIGGTFAYFTATMSSSENAISAQAAVFSIDLTDDMSLLKANIIPTIEDYVDVTSTRVDINGNFLKPIEDPDTHEMDTAGTVCIDDNLNEICSIYTFTIKNPSTEMNLPIYVTISPEFNTFENLYYKILNSDKEVISTAKRLVDERPFTMNGDEKVFTPGSKMAPVHLDAIDDILAPAQDSEHPTEVTYSIVMWIMENNENQNNSDGGKIFAGTLNVTASGVSGNGITGMFSAGGIE